MTNCMNICTFFISKINLSHWVSIISVVYLLSITVSYFIVFFTLIGKQLNSHLLVSFGDSEPQFWTRS